VKGTADTAAASLGRREDDERENDEREDDENGTGFDGHGVRTRV
jgi:hypothetical protein